MTLLLIHPTALWSDKPAAKFNSLAHMAGMQMAAHDKKLGKRCDADNWPYHSDSNPIRRACFEAGYYMGWREV